LNGSNTANLPGTKVERRPAVSGGGNTEIILKEIVQMVSGDYIELMAMQNTGGALNVLQTDATFGSYTQFEMTRLGS
jgi:hypothetical protein